MNVETTIYYALARMHEYAEDICTICEQHSFDYESIIENMVTKHAVNMCLVQMGEFANRISKADKEFYKNSGLGLPQIKGMRDRIAHTYGDIDYRIIKAVLKKHVPELKKAIEALVHEDILLNPYVLHEIEYEQFLDSVSSAAKKPPLTLKIHLANATSSTPIVVSEKAKDKTTHLPEER